MSEEKIEPDAWSFRYNFGSEEKPNFEGRLEPLNPEDMKFYRREIRELKELYSSETIKELIQEMKEEMGEKPSGLDRLDRNAWKERRQTLEELEQRFSEE